MDNKFNEKYPHINYTIDLRKIPFSTWINIGECLSKIEHLSKIPLKPDVFVKMHAIYMAKGAQATTAIEGNTLTEEEVRLRIENKLKLPPSKEYLGKEIDNIIFLCNEMIHNKIPSEGKHMIKVEDILYYNKKILESIPVEKHVVPGVLRDCPVGVGSYKAPDYKDVSALMDEYCTWLNSAEFIIVKEKPIMNSIIKAIAAHVYFAMIHPFGDGNGRTARILEFYILLSSGLPSPAAHLLSNHYNSTRTQYYIQLEKVVTTGCMIEFITYATQGLVDGLREQLDYIFKLVFDLSWESHVYETFRKQKHNELTTKRRRTMVLELSKNNEPVPVENLLSFSRPVIEAYGTKTKKTLSRDLREVEELGLIIKDKNGYRAKKEIMNAFIPFKKITINKP